MRSLWITLVAGVFAVSGWPQSPDAGAKSLDPLVADPAHYHLEFQNQWVRVIRERMGPHESELLHHHPEPGAVVVYLTDQNTRQTSEDGTIRIVRHKAGDVRWSPASTHRGENQNDAPFEYIGVEPKPSASGAGSQQKKYDDSRDGLIVEPQHYHVEFENELVRVIRFTLEPHEKGVMHTHPPTGAILVALTAQNTHQLLSDGTARDNQHKAGEVWWGAPNIAHQDENMLSTRTVLIRIELKQAR